MLKDKLAEVATRDIPDIPVTTMTDLPYRQRRRCADSSRRRWFGMGLAALASNAYLPRGNA